MMIILALDVIPKEIIAWVMGLGLDWVQARLISLMYNKVAQTIVVTSKTEKYLWDTKFSHYLGQKHDRNAKKIKSF